MIYLSGDDLKYLSSVDSDENILDIKYNLWFLIQFD